MKGIKELHSSKSRPKNGGRREGLKQGERVWKKQDRNTGKLFQAMDRGNAVWC